MEQYAFQVQYAEIDLTAKDQNVYVCPYIFSTVLEALLHFYLTFILKRVSTERIPFIKVKNPDGFFFYHTEENYSVNEQNRASRLVLRYSQINILIFKVDDASKRVWIRDSQIEVPVEEAISVPFASQNFSGLSQDVLRGSLLSDNEIFSIFGNCQYATYLSRNNADALEQLGFVEDVIRMVASEELRISDLLISPFLYSAMQDFSSRSDDCFRSASIAYQPSISHLDLYFLRQVFSNMIFHNVSVQLNVQNNSVFFLYNHRFVFLFEILKEHAESSTFPDVSPYTVVTLTEDGLSIDNVDFTWEMMSHVYFHVLQYFIAFVTQQQSTLFFKTSVAPHTFVPLINDHGKLSLLLFGKSNIDDYKEVLEGMSNLELSRFERNLTLRASYYSSELSIPHIANTSSVNIFDNVSYVPLESDVEDASLVGYEGLFHLVTAPNKHRAKFSNTNHEMEVGMLCWLYYQRFVILPAGTVCYVPRMSDRFTGYFSLLDALAFAQQSSDPEKWTEVREVRFAKAIILLDFSFCESPANIVHAFNALSGIPPFLSILKEVYPFVSGYVGEERRSFVFSNPSSFVSPTFRTIETNADHETLRSILYKQQCSFKTTLEDAIPPMVQYEPNMDVLKNVNLRDIVWEGFQKPFLWHGKMDAFYWIHVSSSFNFIDVILGRIFGVADESELIPSSIVVKANLENHVETLLIYMKPKEEAVTLIPGAWRIRRFNTEYFFNPIAGMIKEHYIEFLTDAEAHVSHYTSLSSFEMGSLLGLEGEIVNLSEMNPAILKEPHYEPSTEVMHVTEAEMDSYRFVPDYSDVTVEEFTEADKSIAESTLIKPMNYVQDIPEEEIIPSLLTPSPVVEEIVPAMEESPDDALLKKELSKIYSSRDATYELTLAVGKGVSGELQRHSLQEILNKIELNENSVMGDIGAGRGNVLFHAFLSKKCTGYGWELDDHQFQLYEANRATIKHHLKNLSPALLKKLPHVYHEKVEGDDISALTHFADVTHFYSFDTAMPQSTYIDMERLLNKQRTWRYFCSTTKTYNYENLINAQIIYNFPIHTRGGKGQHQVWIFKRSVPPPILTPVEALTSPLLPQLMPIEQPLPVIMNGLLDFTIGDRSIKKNDVLESILSDFMLQTTLILYKACVGTNDFYIGMNEKENTADLFMVARVPSPAKHTAVALMNQNDVITTVRFDAALFADSILPVLTVLQSNLFMDAPLKWTAMVQSASELARNNDLLKDDEVITFCGTQPPMVVPKEIILPIETNNILEKLQNLENNMENNNNNNTNNNEMKRKRDKKIFDAFYRNQDKKSNVDYIRIFFLNTTKPIFIKYDVKHPNKGNLNHIEFTEPISESKFTLSHVAPFSDAKKKMYNAVHFTNVEDTYNSSGHLASLKFTSSEMAPIVFRESKKDQGLSANVHIRFSSFKMERLAKAMNDWFSDAFAMLMNVPVTLEHDHFDLWKIISSDNIIGVFTGDDAIDSNITALEEYNSSDFITSTIISNIKAGIFTDDDLPLFPEDTPKWKKIGSAVDFSRKMKIKITMSNGVWLKIPTSALYLQSFLFDSSLNVLRKMENYNAVLESKEEASETVTETELLAESAERQESVSLQYKLQDAMALLTSNQNEVHLANVFYNRPATLSFERRESYLNKAKSVHYSLHLRTNTPDPTESSGIYARYIMLPSETAQKTYNKIEVTKLSFEIRSNEVVLVIHVLGKAPLYIRPKKGYQEVVIDRPRIYYPEEAARRFRKVLNDNLEKVVTLIGGKHVRLYTQQADYTWHGSNSLSSLNIAVLESSMVVVFAGVTLYGNQYDIPEIKLKDSIFTLTNMHVIESASNKENRTNNNFSLILTILNRNEPLIFDMPYRGDYEFETNQKIYSLMVPNSEINNLEEESSSSSESQEDVIMNNNNNNNTNFKEENNNENEVIVPYNELNFGNPHSWRKKYDDTNIFLNK